MLVIRPGKLTREYIDGRRARLRTHCGSQKMTIAAMQIADMNVWAQRS
jgi:hypothetical protein